MEKDKNLQIIERCKEVIEKYPRRLGNSFYVTIERNGGFETLDINSEDMYNFISRELFYQRIVLNKNVWNTTISILKGEYNKELLNMSNRIGKINDSIYYDVLNMRSLKPHYIKVNEKGWSIVDENLDIFEWNKHQLAQVLPVETKGNYTILMDYLKNVKGDDRLLYMVYLISCFIPDIQHPILNITGEAGTGKSTLCEIIKSLVDPSKAVLNDFSDGEDGIKIPLAKNYLTVFDNIEKMPSKLNEVFCRVVTGGDTIKRKLYTDDEMVSFKMKSIVVMNGISSAILREDLMTRTIFIRTESIEDFEEHGELLKSFNRNKSIILSGIFDILSKAMSIKNNVNIAVKYRMKEFVAWGYAIAEAMEPGLGKDFLVCMKRNENIQMEENYINEPLISIICRFATTVKKSTLTMSEAFDKFINNGALYYDGDFDSFIASKRSLPKSAATMGKKLRSLKSIFAKCGIYMEFGTTGDVRNLSTITIEKMKENNGEDCVIYQEDMLNNNIKRLTIVGIRKPIFIGK